MKEKIITILGTRPEIIRLSRIIPKLDESFKNILVHTGQNFDYELASHPLVVSVGATTYRDTREGYSNYGAELDLVAPSASVTTDIQGGGR